MQKTRLTIDRRAHYYHGQLLLEEDFLAEQNYHVDARRRHHVNLHGWGVVRGLEVVRKSDSAVTVRPGFAIDAAGNDMPVDRAEDLELAEFGPDDLVEIGLAYEEEAAEDGADKNRRDCYAVLTASRAREESPALVLATVRLDEQGKVRDNAIDYSKTRYAGAVLAPGSVTVPALSAELRTGWLRGPFRPIALTNPPAGETEIPPAFRVGATEALSPDPREAGEKDKGAAGTMAIPIPPSVKKVIRFRVAGSLNDGQIMLTLVLGGWDPVKGDHLRRILVKDTIPSGAFLKTYEIADTAIDAEYQTLALWLRGTRRTSVSLVAVEFAY